MTDNELYSKIDQWALKTYGPGFSFRPSQKETIFSIIHSWQNKTKTVILDAPTGSGKSIIAMTVAGILSDIYDEEGYILISDLSLLEQYERDIERYFPDWAVIKGQTNYSCLENGLNFKLGTCRLEGCKSYYDIQTRFSDCANNCEYMVKRKKSLEAKVVVCTYSFWLIHRNMGEEASYPKKGFTICDEAHKLTDIVQSHFSPSISENDFQKIDHMAELAYDYDESLSIHQTIQTIYSQMKYNDDKGTLFNAVESYSNVLARLENAIEKYKNDEISSKEKKSKIKALNDLIYSIDWLHETSSGFSKYCGVISKCGVDSLVKNPSSTGRSITFNSLDETYLMGSKFVDKCKNIMLMSATIGDPNVFADYTKTSDSFVAYKIPNTFDYTNSPIYFIDEYKMSYAEKERSFPYLLNMVVRILSMYPDKRGIIQTGNYELAKRLYDYIPKPLKNRCLVYTNSSEKQDMIDTYKYSLNSVLIGPTLLEGLSLDDELCRFQIIFKIPYPSLADAFVAEKMKNDYEWYTNNTIISLLQGVGRGVRNEKDWCVTFILDACFRQIYYNNPMMFPAEFSQRIQVIPSTSLLK